MVVTVGACSIQVVRVEFGLINLRADEKYHEIFIGLSVEQLKSLWIEFSFETKCFIHTPFMPEFQSIVYF